MKRGSATCAAGKKNSAARGEHGCVRSFLEIVPVAFVGKNRTRVMKMNFSAGDALSLTGAPLRTIAGLVAAKKAVIACAGGAGLRMDPRLIRIIRSSRGAPRVTGMSRVPALKGVLVSISHTSTHAFGLVARQAGVRRA